MKPSVLASKNSFFRKVNGTSKICRELEKRNLICQKRNKQKHPLIFEIVSKSCAPRYAVGIGDIYYPQENLVEAVDVAFKLFKMLRIEYPLESEKVWQLLEAVFYKTGKNIVGDLLSIKSDLII